MTGNTSTRTTAKWSCKTTDQSKRIYCHIVLQRPGVTKKGLIFKNSGKRWVREVKHGCRRSTNINTLTLEIEFGSVLA